MSSRDRLSRWLGLIERNFDDPVEDLPIPTVEQLDFYEELQRDESGITLPALAVFYAALLTLRERRDSVATVSTASEGDSGGEEKTPWIDEAELSISRALSTYPSRSVNIQNAAAIAAGRREQGRDDLCCMLSAAYMMPGPEGIAAKERKSVLQRLREMSFDPEVSTLYHRDRLVKLGSLDVTRINEDGMKSAISIAEAGRPLNDPQWIKTTCEYKSN